MTEKTYIDLETPEQAEQLAAAALTLANKIRQKNMETT